MPQLASAAAPAQDGDPGGVEAGAGGDAAPREAAVAPAVPISEAEREAQRIATLGWLARGINHELANSLGAIAAFASLLRVDPRVPADLAGEASLLAAEADRTRRIVVALIDTLRTRPHAVQAVALGPLVQAALDLEADELHGVDLRVDVPADLPEVGADASELAQALLHLTANALHALGGRDATGMLRVRARAVAAGDAADPAIVRLVIEDSAPAVDADERPFLFVAGGPALDRLGGSRRQGLDLPVAAALLAENGAAIRHEPVHAATGNRFVVELPVAGSAAVTATASADVAGHTAAAREVAAQTVLVCDDEDLVRSLVVRMVEQAGYRVLGAPSAGEAMALLSDGSIDVLVSDLRMAEMSGIDLYGIAVAREPRLRGRFVLMSGDAESPEVEAFAVEHGVQVLAKPFDAARLRAAIVAALEA